MLLGDKPNKSSRLYKPTSKLAELASTFKSSKDDKKEDRHRDRDRDRDRDRNRDSEKDSMKPVCLLISAFPDLKVICIFYCALSM